MGQRRSLRRPPLSYFNAMPLAHCPKSNLARFQRAMQTQDCIDPRTPIGACFSRLEALETDPQHRGSLAGRRIELENRGSVLFRHSGWQRTRSLVAAALQRTEQTASRRTLFHDCGSQAWVLKSLEPPEEYRVAGSSCRDRFCVPCATERSCVITGNVLDLIRRREIRFLTLTIKTTNEPLSDSLDKLYTSFQRLRRRRLWCRSVDGGVAFLENKWSETANRWHPHLHCLLEGRWIDKARLQQTWHDITGDSWIVDIRRPPNNEGVTRYVTKYAGKPFNNTFVNRPQLLDEALLAMAGRKLALTFGRWRGHVLTATPDTGCWEPFASLQNVLDRAAHGDAGCNRILRHLTNRDLADILARSPPPAPAPKRKPNPPVQLDFFGVWQHDGTFKYPNSF